MAAEALATERAMKPSMERSQSGVADIEGDSPLSGVAIALSLLLWIVIAVLGSGLTHYPVLLWKLFH